MMGLDKMSHSAQEVRLGCHVTRRQVIRPAACRLARPTRRTAGAGRHLEMALSFVALILALVTAPGLDSTDLYVFIGTRWSGAEASSSFERGSSLA